MKCKIMHESRGRLRVHMVLTRMTLHQADVAEYYLRALPAVTKVKVSKTDLTGKKELEGAKLTILDSEGKVVETWTSTTEPHYIEMLPIGKSLAFTSKMAPV